MKKIFRNLMMLLCALTAMVSCDESGDKIYLDGFKSSDLMASASDVVLSVDNTKDIVLSMAWKNPTLLSSDETKPAGNGVLKTYLQASPSESFATVKEYSVTDLSKAFTGADLNTLPRIWERLRVRVRLSISASRVRWATISMLLTAMCAR